MAVIICLVAVALIFDFTNGFHDSANAVATVITTKALSYRNAIIMAAILNGVGALIGRHVAETIAGGLVPAAVATAATIGAALFGAIIWNLVTWWFGLPSSSTHALIGGLCGAAAASAGLHAVAWQHVLKEVALPLVLSPLIGGGLAFGLMSLLNGVRAGRSQTEKNRWFRHLQIGSSATMALAHGTNDGQKTMGIITLLLLNRNMIASASVPTWVVLLSGATMAAGTLAGGRRIIATVGEKITKLEPKDGFVAECTSAGVILVNSYMGLPISTTHVVTGSVYGAGEGERPAKVVNWAIGHRMMVAWLLTFPMAAALGALARLAITRSE